MSSSASTHVDAAVRRTRRLAWWIFLTSSCFYLVFTGPHIDTPDGVIMARVTGAMVEQRSVAVAPIVGWSDFGGRYVRGADGRHRFYAWFGLGASLAAIPTYLVGSALEGLASEAERDLFDFSTAAIAHFRLGRFETGPPVAVEVNSPWYQTHRAAFRGAFLMLAAAWTNALVVAATLAGLFLLSCRAGFSHRTAGCVAAAAGLASPLWHYAVTFFSEPLAACALVWFAHLALVGLAPDGCRRHRILAGLALGVTILTKVVHVVLLAPAGLFLLWECRALPRRDAGRRILEIGVGVGACLIVLGLYNRARFGSLFSTGYESIQGNWSTPFWTGIAGLLVSPGRGLLLYCPLVFLAPMLAWRVPSRLRAVLLFGLGNVVTLLLVYARWFTWEGGWCWGPRYLMPAVPFLALPLAGLIEPPSRLGAGRAAVWGIVALSTMVALSGILVDFDAYSLWVQARFDSDRQWFAGRGYDNYYDLIKWDWRSAPILRYWTFPRKHSFFVWAALQKPGMVAGCYLVFGLGLVRGVVGLAREGLFAKGGADVEKPTSRPRGAGDPPRVRSSDASPGDAAHPRPRTFRRRGRAAPPSSRERSGR